MARGNDAAGGPAGEGAMLSLCHPGLPAFLEKIEDRDGAYILRGYMPGLPLGQYARMPLQQKEAVHIICGLCVILAYLHGQSPPVIHRDIKPSNIMLEPEHVADGVQSVSAAWRCKIIRRCTAFDPAKRYTHVMHLKRDLLFF